MADSDDPAHALLAQADFYWMKINNAYYHGARPLEDVLIPFPIPHGQARASWLLYFAEWHHGQENYALAAECLRQVIVLPEFAQLPDDLQETFRNLRETLVEMLRAGVPPGVFTHTSPLLQMTITASPQPPALVEGDCDGTPSPFSPYSAPELLNY